MRQFKNWIFFSTEWSRSYMVLALKADGLAIIFQKQILTIHLMPEMKALTYFKPSF